MTLILAVAFVSGIVTILTPCIWPLLPIILASSISAKNVRKRALGITLGIMISFAIFTLSTAYLVRIFHFDPNILRLVATVIIALLGLTMIIPPLALLTEFLISRFLNAFVPKKQKQDSGFFPGLVAGFSLGIIWSPCAGPILATIATIAAIGKVTSTVVLITFAYVAGVGIPLFIFAYGGQQVILKSKFVSKYLGQIRTIFGIFMILTALAIYTNYDQVIQTKILDRFPFLASTLTNFENNPKVQEQLDILKGKKQSKVPTINTIGILNTNIPAPDFIGITKWLNTDEALSLEKLKGKVVLVDFWTYTCINCIRTLPHVTSWYEKYNDSSLCSGSLRSPANNSLPAGLKDKCFIVVGVHTPEFEFEKDTNNVLSAIKKFQIHYPVAQDNNYETWNNFDNRYWPAEYLIDAKGAIRRIHSGEGDYDKQEQAIQLLLKEAGQQISGSLLEMPDQTPQNRISPETYFGSKRMEFYYPTRSIKNGTKNFILRDDIPENSFSLGGTWTINDQSAIALQSATLNYNFTASKVFVILRPNGKTEGKIKVYLDGNLIDSTNAGADVQNGIVTVTEDKLYNAVDLKGKFENHILKLEFDTPGLELYTFTFG